MKFLKPIFTVYSIKENLLLRTTLQEEDQLETEIEALQKIDELCRNSEDSEFTYLKIFKSIK